MSKDIFEEASRLKLRFKSDMGTELHPEYLWGMREEDLDAIYRPISIEMSADSHSLLKAATKEQTLNQLRVDIIKHIIAYNRDAAASKAEVAELNRDLRELREISNDKAKQTLLKKPKSSIDAEIAKLEAKIAKAKA